MKLYAAIAAAMISIGVINFLTLNVINKSVEAMRLVSHTNEVIGKTVQARFTIQHGRAEAMLFVINGDNNNLKKSEADFISSMSAIDAIENLTIDNPSQQARMSEVRGLIASNRLDNISQCSKEEIRAITSQTFENINSILLSTSNEESRLLALRTQATNSTISIIHYTAMSAGFISMTIIGITFMIMIAQQGKLQNKVYQKSVLEGKLTLSNKFLEQYKFFFDLSTDMMCLANATCLFEVNDSFERVLGWTKQEITSTPYINFVHHDDLEKTAKTAEFSDIVWKKGS